MAISGLYKGWRYDASADELTVLFDGTEVMAINSTGVSFFGAAPAAQSATIADISVTGTYATDDTPIETAVNSIIAALVAHGIVAAA